MTLNGWIQIAIYFAVLTALVVPLHAAVQCRRVLVGLRDLAVSGSAAAQSGWHVGGGARLDL